MWRLWRLARAYHTRPSDLVGIDDGLAAFHFDNAVWMFGSELDEALRQATEPRKQGKKLKPLTEAQKHHAVSTVLEKWLGITGIKNFRDPAAGLGKR